MITLITKPFDGYALLYIFIYMCLHNHEYVMDFHIFMVILRSATGPYGGRIWGDFTFTPPRLYGR